MFEFDDHYSDERGRDTTYRRPHKRPAPAVVKLVRQNGEMETVWVSLTGRIRRLLRQGYREVKDK